MLFLIEIIVNYFFNYFFINTEKKYWEDEVEKDDWEWIIEEKDWSDYFNGIENDLYDIKFINYQDKGFIFLRDFKNSNKIYIHFAFVSIEYRKKGILKLMINDIKKKYNKYSISLESADLQTDNVWERLGFHCIEKRKKEKLNNYLYKEKID